MDIREHKHSTDHADLIHVDYEVNGESIMGARAEWSSLKWVCIPEITSDSEWFLWNTNSWGWTRYHMGVHDRFFSFHNVLALW